MEPRKNLDAWKLSSTFVKDADIAEGSLSELDTLIERSFELNFCSKETSENLLLSLENISKRIFGLIRKLESEL